MYSYKGLRAEHHRDKCIGNVINSQSYQMVIWCHVDQYHITGRRFEEEASCIMLFTEITVGIFPGHQDQPLSYSIVLFIITDLLCHPDTTHYLYSVNATEREIMSQTDV